MFERSELALKALSGVAVALLLYRLVVGIIHFNPLYYVTIPSLPSLPTASTSGTNSGAGPIGSSVKAGTNHPTHLSASGTNTPVHATNLVATSSNVVKDPKPQLVQGTNIVGRGTNDLARGTNTLAHATNTLAKTTNSAVNLAEARPGPNGPRPPGLTQMGMPMGMGPGMPPGGFLGMPKPGPELTPEVQSRIDRVIDSEILAPVMRPMPMALLGIAGKDVFFRAPNGQTGLIKEGDELGGVKLVRIGVNRVLVEEQGERKELTIFSGLGSESLLSNQKDTSK
jgi:hypothetical protein